MTHTIQDIIAVYLQMHIFEDIPAYQSVDLAAAKPWPQWSQSSIETQHVWQVKQMQLWSSVLCAI